MTVTFVIVPLGREYVLGINGFNKVLRALCGHTIPLVQIQSIGYGEPTHTSYQVINHIITSYYGQK